jgi:hypothetical protein
VKLIIPGHARAHDSTDKTLSDPVLDTRCALSRLSRSSRAKSGAHGSAGMLIYADMLNNLTCYRCCRAFCPSRGYPQYLLAFTSLPSSCLLNVSSVLRTLRRWRLQLKTSARGVMASHAPKLLLSLQSGLQWTSSHPMRSRKAGSLRKREDLTSIERETLVCCRICCRNLVDLTVDI